MKIFKTILQILLAIIAVGLMVAVATVLLHWIIAWYWL